MLILFLKNKEQKHIIFLRYHYINVILLHNNIQIYIKQYFTISFENVN